MANMSQHFVLPDRPYESYDEYLEHTGNSAVFTAREMGASAVLEELRRSGLRGRGGAGFPAAVKWSTVYSHPCPTRYVVCNAAEGEPGTFKDRLLLRRNPYAPLEGMLIAAHVLGARDLYIATKASFERELVRLRGAIQEMREAGLLDYHDIHVVEGPDEYLFGEEKGLLEVIEGNEPLPREAHSPPYEVGLFATPQSPNPALVNNLETFAHVPSIVRGGGESFGEVGTRDTPGTLLFTVSGDVQRPGVYERPAGISLGELVFEVCGGLHPGRTLKAILSGVSNAPIPADKLDVPLDFASLALLGSGLGSAGFVVLDDRTDMVRVAQAVTRFLYVESCNQCTACKYGLGVASGALEELFDPHLASPDDIERAIFGARHAPQGNRCYLPVQGSVIVPSLLNRFRQEAVSLLSGERAPAGPYQLPKIVDFDEETRVFSYDERQARKNPDWTFEDDAVASLPRPSNPRGLHGPPLGIRLTPEVSHRLTLIARREGRDLDKLANEVLRRWLDHEEDGS